MNHMVWAAVLCAALLSCCIAKWNIVGFGFAEGVQLLDHLVRKRANAMNSDRFEFCQIDQMLFQWTYSGRVAYSTWFVKNASYSQEM